MGSPLHYDRPDNFDTKRWLYHYTSCDTALDYIVGTEGTLRLNQLANVNDPRESKFDGFSMHRKGDTSSEPPFRRVSEYFRNRIKILCFSQDDQRVPTPPNIAPEPFLRGYCKPRMWATYGDNHKGVCLVFDSEKLISQLCQQYSGVRCGAVHYDDVIRTTDGWMWRHLTHKGAFSFDSDALQSDFNTEICRMIETHYQNYFFNKHEDWSGETEYRLLVHDSAEHSLFLDYGNSLVGMAVGMDCDTDHIARLKEVADNRRIPLVQPEWSLTWGQNNLNDFSKNHRR